jgi:hypothetical protein
MFAEAWDYHPFGPVFLAVFAVIAVVSLMGPAMHGRLAAWVWRHTQCTRAVYAALMAAFISHGILRALLHMAQGPTVFALVSG